MAGILELAKTPLNTLLFAAILYVGFLLFRALGNWVQQRNADLATETKLRVDAAYMHGVALKSLISFQAQYERLTAPKAATPPPAPLGAVQAAASGGSAPRAPGTQQMGFPPSAEDRLLTAIETVVAHFTRRPTAKKVDPAYDPVTAEPILSEAELARNFHLIDEEIVGFSYYYLQHLQLFMNTAEALHKANDAEGSTAHLKTLQVLIDSAAELVVLTKAINDEATRKLIKDGTHPELILMALVNAHKAEAQDAQSQIEAADQMVTAKRAGERVNPNIWASPSAVSARRIGLAGIDPAQLYMQAESYEVANVPSRRWPTLWLPLGVTALYFMAMGAMAYSSPKVWDFFFGSAEDRPACTSTWSEAEGLSVSCSHVGAEIPEVIEGLRPQPAAASFPRFGAGEAGKAGLPFVE